MFSKYWINSAYGVGNFLTTFSTVAQRFYNYTTGILFLKIKNGIKFMLSCVW